MECQSHGTCRHSRRREMELRGERAASRIRISPRKRATRLGIHVRPVALLATIMGFWEGVAKLRRTQRNEHCSGHREQLLFEPS